MIKIWFCNRRPLYVVASDYIRANIWHVLMQPNINHALTVDAQCWLTDAHDCRRKLYGSVTCNQVE